MGQRLYIYYQHGSYHSNGTKTLYILSVRLIPQPWGKLSAILFNVHIVVLFLTEYEDPHQRRSLSDHYIPGTVRVGVQVQAPEGVSRGRLVLPEATVVHGVLRLGPARHGRGRCAAGRQPAVHDDIMVIVSHHGRHVCG